MNVLHLQLLRIVTWGLSLLTLLPSTLSLPLPSSSVTCSRELTSHEKADLLANKNGGSYMYVEETRSYVDMFNVNELLDDNTCDSASHDFLCPTLNLIGSSPDYFPQAFDQMSLCRCQGRMCRFPESPAWPTIPWVTEYTCVQNLRYEFRLRRENACDASGARKWQLVRLQLPAGCSCAKHASISTSVPSSTPPPAETPTTDCHCTEEEWENGNCPCA